MIIRQKHPYTNSPKEDPTSRTTSPGAAFVVKMSAMYLESGALVIG